MAIRVLFLGTPDLSVPTLQLLARDPRFEVVGVVTQPDKPAGRGLKLTPPPVKTAAEELNLRVLQPATLRESRIQETLRALRPDVGAVVAYGQWIPTEVSDLPPKRSLNLHPSLLPRHRGAAPLVSAILAGDTYVGLSVHFVEEQVDAGDLLAQAAVPMGQQDTAGSMMAKLAPLGALLMADALSGWAAGEINPQPQDHSQATWIGRLVKDQGRIDWRDSAQQIACRCRAYSPWPGTFCFYEGSRLLLHRATALANEKESVRPGTVVHLSSGAGIAVVTGDGLLVLDEVQLADRRRLDVHSFVRGQRAFVGAVLE